MTCLCGQSILHPRFVQSVRDHDRPFDVYHWTCGACHEVIEELRSTIHPLQRNLLRLAYPVRSVSRTGNPTTVQASSDQSVISASRPQKTKEVSRPSSSRNSAQNPTTHIV